MRGAPHRRFICYRHRSLVELHHTRELKDGHYIRNDSSKYGGGVILYVSYRELKIVEPFRALIVDNVDTVLGFFSALS